MLQITFDNKPSKPTLVKYIRRGLNNGNGYIQLTWGENQITVEKTIYGLVGSGWIGKNSGYDLANSFKTV